MSNSIPAALPAVLVTASVLSIYVHLNLPSFSSGAVRLKELLILEATRTDAAFHRYGVARDTTYKMNRLGVPLNYKTFFIVNLVLATGLSLLCLLFLANPSLSLLLPFLWLIFAHQLVDRLYRTRVKARVAVQAQLMLQLLAGIYSVSANLPQAIERVIPATPRPLRDELEKLILQVKTNQDLKRCLVEFAGRIDNRDIETFVHGIVLSDQFGADAHEVIAKNAEVIRDRIALREELADEVRGKKVIILIFMILLPLAFFWLFTGSEAARQIFTGTAKGQGLVSCLVLVEYLCWYFDSRRGVTEEL